MRKTRSDPAIIHPRIAAWYKLGKGRCQRVHSKAAGTCRITGGFALAPQTSTWGDVSLGAVEPECGGNDALCPRGLPRRGTPGPTRLSYTRASPLGINWVRGSNDGTRLDGTHH